MVYRCSTMFPLLTERKLEPISVVDETFAREHQVLSLYTRLWRAGATKETLLPSTPSIPKVLLTIYTLSHSTIQNKCVFLGIRVNKEKITSRPRSEKVFCGMSRHEINEMLKNIKKTLKTLTNFILSLWNTYIYSQQNCECTLYKWLLPFCSQFGKWNTMNLWTNVLKFY